MPFNNIKKSKVLLLTGLFLLGPLFLVFTNPEHLLLPLVLVPFLWLFLVIFVSVHMFVRWRLPGVTRKRRVVLAGVCATLPVLLLVFQSIHQLSFKDVLIAIALVAAGSFYMLKADFIK